MNAEEIAIEGTGLYHLPGHGRGVAVPVRILRARRTGHLRVDLLVTPVGGFGELWVQQSSMSLFELEQLAESGSQEHGTKNGLA